MSRIKKNFGNLLVLSVAVAFSACDQRATFCDTCEVGAALCDPAGTLVVCEGPDKSGCTNWSPPRKCGPAQICLGGQGACVCRDVCQLTETSCGDNGGQRLCVGPDDDGCYAWGKEEDCAEGETCVGGSCACDKACQPGESRCDEEGLLLTCLEPAAGESCPTWSQPEPCPAHQACFAGACQCLDPCQPEDVVCEGDAGKTTCQGPDDEGCSYWGEAIACLDGLVCNPAYVACLEETPVDCDQINECGYLGQKLCMSDTQYRACKNAYDGCLVWDCST